MTKFYLVAEPDDGLPPIRKQISVDHHAVYTELEKTGDDSVGYGYAKLELSYSDIHSGYIYGKVL